MLFGIPLGAEATHHRVTDWGRDADQYRIIVVVKTTRYFEEDILGEKRPFSKREWCERVLRNPEFTEVQENGRIRYWGFVEEIDRYLRVVTLEDGETVHNAMPDRNFTRKHRRNG